MGQTRSFLHFGSFQRVGEPQKATPLGPGFIPRFDLRRCRKTVIAAGEALVREPLADHADDRLEKAPLIVVLPFVEPERLFVQVAEKVEGLHADICAFDRPFEQ